MKKLLLASLIATSAVANASSGIILSEKIKPKFFKTLERDLDVLDGLKFKDADAETLKLMNLTNLNARTASDWLGARVNYVIEENALSVFKLLIKRVIFEERSNVTFPNSSVIPYSIDPANNKPAVDEEEGVTVMSNIGAALYYGGKTERKVYGMKISRGLLKKSIKVAVESPRAGIIQVGEGLFMDRLTVTPEKPNSVANSINRLATFFHEARHSDGNGSSVGFLHSPCPVGHDYAGVPACDENLNGPYTVGAVMMAEMLKACDDTCSIREKEILKLQILDSKNRIMQTTRKGTAATVWDAAPESL